MTATGHDPSAWIGRTLIDTDGAKLGTIQEIYFDAATNQPPTMAINADGILRNKHRVVPLALATPGGDRLQVPYDKATVTHAPTLDLDDDPPAAQVTALYRHYGLNVDNAHQQRRGTHAPGVRSPERGPHCPTTPADDGFREHQLRSARSLRLPAPQATHTKATTPNQNSDDAAGASPASGSSAAAPRRHRRNKLAATTLSVV